MGFQVSNATHKSFPPPPATSSKFLLRPARLSAGRVAPVGGGAYLRLLPYRYTAAGIRRMNLEEHIPACVYFHPWELDDEQPRIARGLLARLRTYSGIAGMSAKLDRLLREFQFAPLSSVCEESGPDLVSA